MLRPAGHPPYGFENAFDRPERRKAAVQAIGCPQPAFEFNVTGNQDEKRKIAVAEWKDYFLKTFGAAKASKS